MIDELTSKFENAVSEKERLNAIAEDRYFELKRLRNEGDIIALKTYLKDLDKNMMIAINEKKPQIEACQKLINVMRKIIPTKKKTEAPGIIQKLKFRFRKKKDDSKEPEAEEGKEGQENVFIYGKNSKPEPEPTAIDELLEYLYTNFSELFVITGEEK